jgi:hypothetical protein
MCVTQCRDRDYRAALQDQILTKFRSELRYPKKKIMMRSRCKDIRGRGREVRVE